MILRVTTCLENMDMSGNNNIQMLGLSGKKSCHEKLFQNLPKNCVLHIFFNMKFHLHVILQLLQWQKIY